MHLTFDSWPIRSLKTQHTVHTVNGHRYVGCRNSIAQLSPDLLGRKHIFSFFWYPTANMKWSYYVFKSYAYNNSHCTTGKSLGIFFSSLTMRWLWVDHELMTGKPHKYFVPKTPKSQFKRNSKKLKNILFKTISLYP